MRVVKKIVGLLFGVALFIAISFYSYTYLSYIPLSLNTSLWPQQENVKIVTRNNITLWTEHFGNPNNPPILLLHGAGSSSPAFPREFINTLVKAHYFIIRYDQRDSGYSTHFWQAFPNYKGPYTAQDMFDDAWAVLDAYGIEKAHYIGYSMGGYFVSAMLYEKPERALPSIIISAGIAECPQVRKKLGISFRTEETNRHIQSFTSTENFEKDFPMLIEYYSYMHGTHPIDNAFFKNFFTNTYTRNKRNLKAPWNHISAIRSFPPNHINHLKTIITPCLVLHGSEDKVIPIDNGEKLARLIPTAQFVALPGVGHFFFNKDIWEKISKETLAFLKRSF